MSYFTSTVFQERRLPFHATTISNDERTCDAAGDPTILKTQVSTVEQTHAKPRNARMIAGQ